MGLINIEGIRIYAYHGCMEEEALIGGNYVVDISLQTDFSKANQSDNLAHTIDYCEVYEIVKTEMAIRSKLIEPVAQRIMDSLRKKFNMLQRAEVKLTKLNPPINGEVDKVSVVITF